MFWSQAWQVIDAQLMLLPMCCRCEAHEMIFIGDRYLTDVVYGNRHGMLTIRVAPLTSVGEPPTVAAVRSLEDVCVRRWKAAGIKAPAHRLLDVSQCSKVVKQGM